MISPASLDFRAWWIGMGVTAVVMAYATVKQGGHKGIRYPPKEHH